MSNLKVFREKAGLSQSELARRINVKQPSISQVENGDRRPWPKLLKAAAEALDIPYSALEPDLKRRKSEEKQFEQSGREGNHAN